MNKKKSSVLVYLRLEVQVTNSVISVKEALIKLMLCD